MQGKSAEEGKSLKSVVSIQYEPGRGDEPGLWYDEDHLQKLRAVEGYIRSSGFRLRETRAASMKEVPKFLSVHEFDHVDFPGDHIDFDGPDDSRPIFKIARIQASSSLPLHH